MSLNDYLLRLGKNAKQASRLMREANAEKKNRALRILAESLEKEKEAIFSANAQDIAAARQNGLDQAKLNRLTLTPEIIHEMAAACRHVADMPDPIGALDAQWQQPNGILVGRMRVPLGVIAMIFESRPNVVIDASILCLKAGNAVILRGGSEAHHSNQRLAALTHQALEAAGLPAEAAQVVNVTDREAVRGLCKLNKYIDVIIPRGGPNLIRLVSEEATMPVLKHDKGVCHLYVDKDADLDMALNLTFNSKVQRPATCNSLECLLVHADIASRFLPMVGEKLGKSGVIFKACPAAAAFLKGHAPKEQIQDMLPEDFGKEYLSLILAVNIVRNMDEAIAYIDEFGSNHTEVICTNNYSHAMDFLRRVDASMVAVNASVRLNDGGQLGLGAEIGISTTKLHAYGPMGIKELTTTKFTVMGTGQIRC